MQILIWDFVLYSHRLRVNRKLVPKTLSVMQVSQLDGASGHCSQCDPSRTRPPLRHGVWTLLNASTRLPHESNALGRTSHDACRVESRAPYRQDAPIQRRPLSTRTHPRTSRSPAHAHADVPRGTMDLTETLRGEDISKTDFFDFVVAPDVGDHQSALHFNRALKSMGIFLESPAGGPHDCVVGSGGGGGGGGGADDFKETNNNHVLLSSPETSASSAGHFDGPFWPATAYEKEAVRLETAILEDLSKFCWGPDGAGGGGGGPGSDAGSPASCGKGGGAPNNTDGAIYTLTVLNGGDHASTWYRAPEGPAPAAPHPKEGAGDGCGGAAAAQAFPTHPVDLDSILNIMPPSSHASPHPHSHPQPHHGHQQFHSNGYHHPEHSHHHSQQSHHHAHHHQQQHHHHSHHQHQHHHHHQQHQQQQAATSPLGRAQVEGAPSPHAPHAALPPRARDDAPAAAGAAFGYDDGAGSPVAGGGATAEAPVARSPFTNGGADWKVLGAGDGSADSLLRNALQGRSFAGRYNGAQPKCAGKSGTGTAVGGDDHAELRRALATPPGGAASPRLGASPGAMGAGVLDASAEGEQHAMASPGASSALFGEGAPGVATPGSVDDLLLSQLDAASYPEDYEKLKRIAHEVAESVNQFCLDQSGGGSPNHAPPPHMYMGATLGGDALGGGVPGAPMLSLAPAPPHRPKKYSKKSSASGAAAKAHGLAGGGGGSARKERSLHYCNICSKGFKDKYSVNVHIRTHTGEKPFTCALCAKSFRQKAHLAKHYQTHLAHKGATGAAGGAGAGGAAAKGAAAKARFAPAHAPAPPAAPAAAPKPS